jgi:hypothetical protein
MASTVSSTPSLRSFHRFVLVELEGSDTLPCHEHKRQRPESASREACLQLENDRRCPPAPSGPSRAAIRAQGKPTRAPRSRRSHVRRG